MLLVPLLWMGCASPEPATTQVRPYIAPADEQTEVPRDLPLRVVTGPIDIPPGYDVGSAAIHVTEIGGGDVGGTVFVGDDDLEFLPYVAWDSGARYEWTVDQPPAMPHGPTLELPAAVLGSATFTTVGGPVLLGTAFGTHWDPADPTASGVCFVFSAPLAQSDLAEVLVLADGKQLGTPVLPDPTYWSDPYPLLDGDPGLGVACVQVDATFANTVPLRVYLGSDNWMGEPKAETVGDLVRTLRHDH